MVPITRAQRVTIRDVAREAGVSVASVSRVFSKADAVSDKTRRSVLQASRRLGYRPNGVARALRRQATRTVGMLVPQISNPFFPALVESIDRELHDAGFGLLLADAQNSPAQESERVRDLVDRRIDGLLFVPCDAVSSEGALRLVEDMPVVQVDRCVEGFDTDFVSVDNPVGLRQVVSHVLTAGRTRLAFIGADGAIASAKDRAEGFRQGLAEFGRGETVNSVIRLGDFTLEWGSEATRQVLNEQPETDAIICGNDLIALGVLDALRSHGRHVPEDVVVTGYDDIPFAALAVPPLTTVRQPVEDLAAASVRLLMERIENPGVASRRLVLRPSLEIRASAPAALEPPAPHLGP